MEEALCSSELCTWQMQGLQATRQARPERGLERVSRPLSYSNTFHGFWDVVLKYHQAKGWNGVVGVLSTDGGGIVVAAAAAFIRKC
jgi:hypothetical protein